MIHWVGIGEIKSSGNKDYLGTILGSCITTVLWHPQRHFAVMNHILLPARPPKSSTSQHLDGRYADESWRLMQSRIARQGIALRECEAYVAGGAQATDHRDGRIGPQNAEAMLALLSAANVKVNSAHIGGNGSRTAHFDPQTGSFSVVYNGIAVDALIGAPTFI